MTNHDVETETALLTIKEAAARLRVSEVSLRRWTDSGELPCLRVGGRRERRFRAADLRAFVESGTAASGGAVSTTSHACLHGLVVPYGRHLCAFYASPAGCEKLAVPFLIEGLARGERCYLVANDGLIGSLSLAAREARHDLERFITDGSLAVRSPGTNPMETLDYFTDEFARTTRGGHRPMRVLGDMAAFIVNGASVDALMEFESAFERTLAHKYAVVSLCQYDVREFSGVAVLAALEAHRDTFDYPLHYFLGT